MQSLVFLVCSGKFILLNIKTQKFLTVVTTVSTLHLEFQLFENFLEHISKEIPFSKIEFEKLALEKFEVDPMPDQGEDIESLPFAGFTDLSESDSDFDDVANG